MPSAAFFPVCCLSLLSHFCRLLSSAVCLLLSATFCLRPPSSIFFLPSLLGRFQRPVFLTLFAFYIQPLLLFASICLLPPSVVYVLRPSSSCRFLPYSFGRLIPPLDFYRFMPIAALCLPPTSASGAVALCFVPYSFNCRVCRSEHPP